MREAWLHRGGFIPASRNQHGSNIQCDGEMAQGKWDFLGLSFNCTTGKCLIGLKYFHTKKKVQTKAVFLKHLSNKI